MAKKATPIDLVVGPPVPGTTLFRWLYKELRSAILDGRLKRGTRLPSTRELGRGYGVSRGLVVSVFEQLQAEGYLDGKVGRGTYVNSRLPEDLLYAKRGIDEALPERKSPYWLSKYAERLGRTPEARSHPARAFRAATPALDDFPVRLWAQIALRRMRHARRELLADVSPTGYRPLRKAVSEYLGTVRGVRCMADQVIIVAGIQQALNLTARLVLDPGDPVWVEDPCFFGVAAMFEALGARVIAVPVDDSGIVDEGKRRSARAKLVYVTPAHQFPLGPTLSLDRRLALLDWAQKTGGLIFEDDYDSEYRYIGQPIPALQGLDRCGSVIFAGSFSKVLFPSLRLGYMVIPHGLVDKFTSLRFMMDRHSSVIDQAVLCDFITEGDFGRHIRRMRELYASRLAVLRESAKEELKGLLEIPEIKAGLQTVGWLAPGLDAEVASTAAADRGVEVIPINRFVLQNRLPEGLLLGFGAVGTRELRRGVEGLADALNSARRRPKSPRLDTAG